MNYIQLNTKDLKQLRIELSKQQNNKCCLCGCELNLISHIDHKHKTSKETIGENGAGLIRGLLCPTCNLYLGKIENNAKRFGKKDILVDLLRNIADYLEKEPYPYIHPTEKPKEPKVSKFQFNKLVKISGKKIQYPKLGKITKELSILFERYGISPYL